MKTIKTILLTYLFLISISGLYAQKQITNTLTSKHKSVKGTKIHLIPPKDFSTALNFVGLQNETGSSIMVVEIPGPYSETSRGITKENLLTKGVELQEIESFTINGMAALLATGTQAAYGNVYTKYILVFGTEKETVMINGVFPEKLKEIGSDIKKSIMQVFYEEGKNNQSEKALDYSVNVAGTKLKFATNITNSLYYNVDGKVPTESIDKTSLIISNSFETKPIEDKKLYCLNRIRLLPVDVDSIHYINEISYDGIFGYEIYATGKKKGAQELENVYQVMLFSDNIYYILVGRTNDTTDNSIGELKKVISTFKRK